MGSPIWFLFLLLLATGSSFAQDDEFPPISIDTVMVSNRDSFIRFNKLNAGDTYTLEHRFIPDSIVNKLRKDKDFWYVNEAPARKKASTGLSGRPFYLQNWFRTLLWVIIVSAFIAIIIWYLIISDVHLFRKTSSVLNDQEDTELTKDIFSIEYDKEIDKAIAETNYRLAVRLMYLHVLTLLSEKNIIQYKIEKTDSDYLAQLNSSAYYDGFFRLTRNFEYVWYGKFEVSPAAFNTIQANYQTFKNSLQQ